MIVTSCIIFQSGPLYCLSVLVLLSALLMLMGSIRLYIFYCTLHFVSTARQPQTSNFLLGFTWENWAADVDAGRGLDTMGPNISRSLLFWLVLVLPLLADAAVGASATERWKNWFCRWRICLRSKNNKQPCGIILTERSITHWWFPHDILPGFTENLWKIINKYNMKLLWNVV